MANVKKSSIAANMIGRHIADHPEVFEPARSNCFELIIDDATDLLREGVDPATALPSDYINNAMDVIRLSCEDFPIPHYSLGTLEVRRVNSTIKFASTPTWDSGKSFKCTDFVGARTKDVLMALKARAYSINNDVMREAAEYKHTWTVNEYNVDYSKLLRSWKLYGAFITKLDEGDLSHDDNSLRRITVTIEYDRAKADTADELTD